MSLAVPHVQKWLLPIHTETERDEIVLEIGKQQAETNVRRILLVIRFRYRQRRLRLVLATAHGDGEELGGLGGKDAMRHQPEPRLQQLRLLIGLHVDETDDAMLLLQVEQDHRQIRVPAVRQSEHAALRLAVLVARVAHDLNVAIERQRRPNSLWRERGERDRCVFGRELQRRLKERRVRHGAQLLEVADELVRDSVRRFVRTRKR